MTTTKDDDTTTFGFFAVVLNHASPHYRREWYHPKVVSNALIEDTFFDLIGVLVDDLREAEARLLGA